MNNMEMELKDLDKLQKNLKKAIQKYPDMAADRLESISKDFKKRVIQIAEQSNVTYTRKILKGYKLDKLQNNGINMQKVFHATAPQVKLIEKGTKQLDKNGNSVGKGLVPGLQVVKQVIDEYDDKMPEEMQKLFEVIARECDLN